MQDLWSALAAGQDWQGELSNVNKNGDLYWVSAVISPVKDEDGQTTHIIAIKEDITEKKNLQNQLRQAQKMEAIGQLAGGVSHDFNNILQTIIGFAGLMQMKLPTEDPLRSPLDNILAATDRASNLTRQLLAFSRKQVLHFQPVNLNETLRKMETFLRRIIGEDVEVEIILKEELLTANADSGQIEQLLMNLATNARDAMPRGGLFSIVAEKIVIDEQYIKAYGYGVPGEFVQMSVSDTGCGMDAGTVERIFEPFFSTKGPDKGSGLGLAIAYGIVKQHKGFINVYTELGKGTTFKVYLPLIAGQASQKTEMPTVQELIGGNETILLAEDETSIRQLNTMILTDFGYTVIEAKDGEEAIQQFNAFRDQVNLLLFDLVMPKKSGMEAYAEICKSGVNKKAIFISGYPTEVVRKNNLFKGDFEIVMKPISPQNLLKKVREVLDRD
jgi:signal transduction histidine kinase